jgi:hypothetical protein
MASHGRPLKMFTEKDEDWPIWEIDFEGWSIRKGFKRFLKEDGPQDHSKGGSIVHGYNIGRPQR